MTDIAGDDTYFQLIDSNISQEQWEVCIDQAVDLMNAAIGEDIIANMTGTAGSKTLSVTSGQAGFIRAIAVQVYLQDYKTAGATSESVAVGGASISHSSSSSASIGGVTAWTLALEAAKKLKEIEVSYG